MKLFDLLKRTYKQESFRNEATCEQVAKLRQTSSNIKKKFG